MASVTIRDLPEKIKHKLTVLAAEQGMPLETYLRQVLQNISDTPMLGAMDVLEAADRHFGKENGVGLKLPTRRSSREVVDFQ